MMMNASMTETGSFASWSVWYFDPWSFDPWKLDPYSIVLAIVYASMCGPSPLVVPITYFAVAGPLEDAWRWLQGKLAGRVEILAVIALATMVVYWVNALMLLCFETIFRTDIIDEYKIQKNRNFDASK